MPQTIAITGSDISAVVARVAEELEALRDPLNQLDAAVGDGDLGITAFKGAAAIREYLVANPPGDDLGKFLGGLGMAFNRAASSTMGALVATGLSNAETAAQLVITEATVRSHVSNILGKLHLTNRVQATLYALQEGIISLDEVRGNG